MIKPNVNPNDVYTIDEACAALGVNRRTLNRYTAAGSIKSHIRRADNRTIYFGRDITQCYYATK